MELYKLETPALVLDKDLFEENIKIMDSLLAGSSARLRPHFKTTKCIEIAKRQIEAGAKGITCSKLSEAEVLAHAGIEDILIANEIVQPTKVRRLAVLAGKCKLTVCVDNTDNLVALSQAAVGAGTTIHVYVECNVGLNRCGVCSKEEFVALAKQVEAADHLEFDGIQAYAGQLSHEENVDLRLKTVQDTETILKEYVAYAVKQGITVKEISGASSATTAWKAQDGIYTELQAGSYVFMDMAFSNVKLPFKNSLFVRATIISKNKFGITLDVGAKSFGLDQCYPKLLELPDHEVMVSEEHFTVFGNDIPYEVGDHLTFVPGHCCTTVNIFDMMFVKQGNEIIDQYIIAGRGKSQ